MQPRATSEFSYVAAVKSPMDNNRFNGVNKGPNAHFGGSLSPQGIAEGSSLRGPNACVGGSSTPSGNVQGSYPTHGGFHPMNQGFHPGYAGHRSYTRLSTVGVGD
jgi:hypothetical protein